MTNTVKRFIIALAIMVGLVAAPAIASADSVSAARPAPRVVPNSGTDCNQSAYLGARVCFDDTTGYGPVGYVYTDAYTVYSAEGSTNGCNASNVTAFVATPYESSVNSVSTAVSGYMSTQSYEPWYPAIPCYGGDGFFLFSPGFHDILEWVLNCRCGYEYVHVK